uniref:BZIP domain-containing protein n=1 Tax=Kalanchoe fedtschenkoi TaxID=63787 RepID=A0A7N0TL19_KALFE
MGSQDNGVEEPTPAQDGSIFNLTLDEVQSQLDSLGKPLSSMNLDELMRTVCAAESSKGLGTANVAAQGQTNTDSNSQMQGGVTLSRDLGAKTVDEVWRDIQQGRSETNCEDKTVSGRQPTLGELTLEDFLAKAGIVAETPTIKGNGRNAGDDSHNSLPQPSQWMEVQQPMIQQPIAQPPMLQCGNMVPVFLPGHHHAHQSLPMAMAYPHTQTSLSSPHSAGTMSDTSSVVRKRVATADIGDKSAERRHKRMIKNRESAARSRARKQAYTQQLEERLAELEEENAKLKGEEVMVASQLPSPLGFVFNSLPFIVIESYQNMIFLTAYK